MRGLHAVWEAAARPDTAPAGRIRRIGRELAACARRVILHHRLVFAWCSSLSAGGVYAYDHARADEIAKGVKVGGRRARRPRRADRGAGASSSARSVSRSSADRRPPRHARTFTLGPRERAWSPPTSTRMVDEALARSRERQHLRRALVALDRRQRCNDDLTPDGPRTPTRRSSALLDQVRKAVDRPASRRRASKIDGHGRRRRPTGRTGSASRPTAAPRRSARARDPDAERAHRRRRRATPSPRSDRGRLEQEVRDGDRRQPRPASGSALQEPQARQDLPRSPSAGRASRRPPGLYHIQNKAVNPAWHVPNSAWAGSLAGKVIPAGPGQPDQGALAGDLRRRRHPRHRSVGVRLDRPRRLARLHPHDDPRRDRPLRPRCPVGAPIYIA